MKQLLLIPLLLAGSIPVEAREYQPGYSNQCFEEVYREEYIPGTLNNPGRIKRYTDTIEVPCNGSNRGRQGDLFPPNNLPSHNTDTNSCVEGSILGGILGGALGGTAATQENWIWSIPTGVVGGAMVGCQIDGG